MNHLKKILLLGILIGFSAGGILAQGAYMGYGVGLQLNLGDLGGTITKDGLANKFGTQKIIIPENTIDVYRNTGIATGKTTGAMTGLLLSAFYEVDSANTFWRVGVEYTRKVLGGHSEASFAGYKFIDQNWDFNSLVVPFYWGLKASVGDNASVYGGLGLNYFRGGWSLSGTVDGATPCKIAYEQTGHPADSQVTALACGLGPNAIGLINPANPNKNYFTLTYTVSSGFILPECTETNCTGTAPRLAIISLPAILEIFGLPPDQAKLPLFENPVGKQATELVNKRVKLGNIDKLYDGAIFGEKVVFDVSGIGFNFMIGFDAKVQGGNKLYFEIEYLLDAKMDNAPVRSQGTINQLAATGNISYPVVIGGVRYKFGYKMPAAF